MENKKIDSKYSLTLWIFLSTSIIFALQYLFNIYLFPGYKTAIRFYLSLISFSTLFVSISLLFRSKKVVILIIESLLTILIYCNIVYFRSYNDIIPISSYKLVSNLNGYLSAILQYISWKDIFILTPLILQLIVNRVIVLKKNASNNYLSSFVLLIITIVSFYNSKLNIIAADCFDIKVAAANGGLLGRICINIHNTYFTINTISDSDFEEINTLFNIKKSENNNYNQRDKNLIIIILEAVESWPIGLTIEGQEITPYLNSLIHKKDSIIYFSKVITQIKAGRSIDGQFIINSGLLPPKNNVISFSFINRKYPTISSLFAKKSDNDYETCTFIGYNPEVWNQQEFNKSLGIDSLISIYNYNNCEKSHFGINDKDFLLQTSNKLVELQKPFYSQIITSSTHSPYDINPDWSSLSLSNDYNKLLKGYLLCMNYIDHCVKCFIDNLKSNSLYDESIIVIASDHYSDGSINTPIWQKGINNINSKCYTPLIILNAPVFCINNEKEVEQIDIFPTIEDIMGIECKSIGVSLLNTKYDSIKSSISTQYDLDYLSDIIIKSDFFSEKH